MSIVYLLKEDPDLAEQLPEPARSEAFAALRVRSFEIGAGEWSAPTLEPGAAGLLLLGGLMVRKIALGPGSSADLVGPGDIIRPWEGGLIPGLVPYVSSWAVLEKAVVALLDERITRAMGRWPTLGTTILSRFVRRSRSLAYLMAAHNFRRVDDRLLASLWHLASLWGRVTPDGIRVPFRLSHSMLGDIISARRPSVSVALKTLDELGLVSRDDHGCYMLHGDPPDWQHRLPPLAKRES